MEALYMLPFDARHRTVHISQGFNGPSSHFDLETKYGSSLDLTYAIDFALPFGTEVHAARGGCVFTVFTKSQTFYEGTDQNVGNNGFMITNIVVVQHIDTTYGLYAHLAYLSERVRIGQVVSQGEVLAVTGPSGWIGPMPHVHFMVYTRIPRPLVDGRPRAAKVVSMPFRFQNYQGSLEHQIELD